MQGTLSVIIPAWSGTPELIAMTLDLIRTVRPMCDEIVVTEDGPYQKEIEEAVDVYILHPRLGHGVNLALGFRASTGEYVALMDSDIHIESGSLRDMVIPGRVVCPTHPTYAKFQGWFVVAPRWVISQCPPYDRIDGKGDGIDFWAEELGNLSKDILVNVDTVKYRHGDSATYSTFRKVGDLKPLANNGTKERMEREMAVTKARMMEDPDVAQMLKERMPREVAQDRHRQRLEEDPLYRRVWLYVL